ncbi:peptidylprolyl isomerase [Roseococcus microcysteis]|uniref:peptidylprolyl isomerase n=1 Tax=Roseococcus microcysteis TaxID=2771361 RepID=UPI001CC69C7D|nr:peptidylprolyl isomerase [Roseococcus microcysteis]
MTAADMRRTPTPRPNFLRWGPARMAALGLGAALALGVVASPAAAQRAPAAQAAPGNMNRILAVVNGDVVTQMEVASRARLFALNIGMAGGQEAITRLEPQMLRLLIDERLRMQEVQRRGIPVSDQDILESITDIERRNNLPAGALVAQLQRMGVQPRVLYDQIRVQIGWGRLLRQGLGDQAQVSDAEVAELIAARRARTGVPEFLVAEIFIPVENPDVEAETQRFVQEIINQLRRGSPFPVVATQFSQAQSALQGGDLGWVVPERLDPEVAAIVTQMPPGAISNPVRVAGGFQIVTLRARREAGQAAQVSTMVSLRQIFLPFAERLDPNNPTDQQRATLDRAQRLQGATRGCAAAEALPRTSDRPLDPGAIRLEGVNPPPLRQVLASLPIGRFSEPLIAPDGILLLMVCGRERQEEEQFTPEIARQTILRDRVELVARQLQRELRRRAIIDQRV